LRGRRSGIGLAVDRAADRSREAVPRRVLRLAWVFHPLGFARLAGDDRDRVRRGGRVFGGEIVVEDGEPAGVAPEERNGVAVDMRHDEARELLAHHFACGASKAGVSTPFDFGELVHFRNAVLHVDLGGKADMGMVGRVLDRRVLLGADSERLDRHRLAGVFVEVALGEPWRVGGRPRSLAIGIDAVDAGKRAIFVIERAVLIEDDEHVFDLLSQRGDLFGGPFGSPCRL
jgi:hypothetical protein